MSAHRGFAQDDDPCLSESGNTVSACVYSTIIFVLIAIDKHKNIRGNTVTIRLNYYKSIEEVEASSDFTNSGPAFSSRLAHILPAKYTASDRENLHLSWR